MLPVRFMLIDVSTLIKGVSIYHISFPTFELEARALWLSDLTCFQSGEEASVLAVRSWNYSASGCSR